MLTSCHLTVERLGYKPSPAPYRYATESHIRKKDQLKTCFTVEIICVVLKEVQEQRQRPPHMIADMFLGQDDHQR